MVLVPAVQESTAPAAGDEPARGSLRAASPRRALLRAVHDPYLVDVVLARYQEPHRHYHDGEHVAEMFRFARELGFALAPAQRLAVLFHDFEYVPAVPKGDNERASAAVLQRLVRDDPQLRVYARFADAAAAMILDTIDHRTPSSPASAQVLDLDLARLGVPYSSFREHVDQLFHEFRPRLASDNEFWQGSAAFYRALLARERIFHTDEGHARFEVMARSNMARLIKAIESVPLPGLCQRPVRALNGTQAARPA